MCHVKLVASFKKVFMNSQPFVHDSTHPPPKPSSPTSLPVVQTILRKASTTFTRINLISLANNLEFHLPWGTLHLKCKKKKIQASLERPSNRSQKAFGVRIKKDRVRSTEIASQIYHDHQNGFQYYLLPERDFLLFGLNDDGHQRLDDGV